MSVGDVRKLKTSLPLTKVPVHTVTSVYNSSNNAPAGYFNGWWFPFSILKPGRIEVIETYENNINLLAHELQHANDCLNPLRRKDWKNNFSRRIRAYTRQMHYVPLNLKKEILRLAVNAIQKAIPAATEAHIKSRMEAQAKEWGFDLMKDHNSAKLPWV